MINFLMAPSLPPLDRPSPYKNVVAPGLSSDEWQSTFSKSIQNCSKISIFLKFQIFLKFSEFAKIPEFSKTPKFQESSPLYFGKIPFTRSGDFGNFGNFLGIPKFQSFQDFPRFRKIPRIPKFQRIRPYMMPLYFGKIVH